jgi:hypothetical protein
MSVRPAANPTTPSGSPRASLVPRPSAPPLILRLPPRLLSQSPRLRLLRSQSPFHTSGTVPPSVVRPASRPCIAHRSVVHPAPPLFIRPSRAADVPHQAAPTPPATALPSISRRRRSPPSRANSAYCRSAIHLAPPPFSTKPPSAPSRVAAVPHQAALSSLFPTHPPPAIHFPLRSEIHPSAAVSRIPCRPPSPVGASPPRRLLHRVLHR